MKSALSTTFKRIVYTTTLLGAVTFGGSQGVLAEELACDTGNLIINAITPNPVYVDHFPATVPLSASLSSSGPGLNFDSLQPISVTFNDDVVSSVLTVGDPNTTATVDFSVNIPAPGSYVLIIRGERGSTDYCDTESLAAFEMVTIEYKAPPAIANAYINSLETKLPGRVRGCIISAIAQWHGKDEAYGPKGGPYCETGSEAICAQAQRAVHHDVDGLTACY